MADLLGAAISGLRVAQLGLSTTQHNISNVNTPGFSRQSILQVARDPTSLGGFFIGTGAEVTDIRRNANDMLNSQLRESVSSLNQLLSLFDSASQIDTLMSNPQTGIGAGIDNFFSDLSGVISDPASIPSRQAFLSQAGVLVNRFRTINTELNNQASVVDAQIRNVVGELNTLTANLAQVNFQIGASPTPPPDLLDKRDELLKEISSRIGISSFVQDDGAANVFISTGQSLVIGANSETLTTVNAQDDPTRLDIAFQSDTTVLRINRSDITGGQLGGLVNFRSTIIEPAIRTVNRLALGLSSAVNAQHQLGMDLNGSLGGNFFNDINATQSTLDRAVANSDNLGSATLAVNILDTNALTNSDYELTFNGAGSFSLRNLSDNTTTNFPSLPTTLNGFTVSLNSGAMAAGDRFFISPGRYAARDISLSVVDPAAIALADPIRTTSGANNAGTGAISVGQTIDTSNATFATAGALTPPVRVEFLSSTTYRVLDASTGLPIQAGPVPYDPAISNAIFPVPAVHVGAAGGLVASGSLATLGIGELTLNGTAIPAAVADGVSTTDSSASAIAIAAAINSNFSTHGVTASVNATSYNMGTYTTGTVAAGQFRINGQDVIVGAPTQAAMLTAINGVQATTGVVATVNGSNEIILTAADGRNIQIENPVTTAGATFTNFDLTGAPDDSVQRGSVTLSYPTGNLTIGGTAPLDAGFTAGVYNYYDPGYRASISGAPVAGDTFEINYNTSGVSDSRNGLAMSAIQTTKNMDNGTNTFNGVFSNMLVSVGSVAAQAELNAQTADALNRQLQDRVDSVSAVNLDEEAANLLKYQQAYRAAAEALAIFGNISNVLFEVI